MSRPTTRISSTSTRRWGYTTLELILVMVITGVMAAAVTKPISRTWRESSRQAAGRETASYLYRARAAAVQQSRTTWFVRSGDIIKILTDSSGVVVPFGSPLNMNARHGVTVEATRDTITFDPRGFTRLLSPAPRLIVKNTSGADTLCITGLGTISTRTCS